MRSRESVQPRLRTFRAGAASRTSTSRLLIHSQMQGIECMEPLLSTLLSDLDQCTLSGVVDRLQLHEVGLLMQTGDKRLRARVAPTRLATFDPRALIRTLEVGLKASPCLFLSRLVHLTAGVNKDHPRHIFTLEANLLPKTLVTLDALDAALTAHPQICQQLEQSNEPPLPNLKVLRVASFDEPLYLLSHILTSVKMVEGDVNFGDLPPRGRYTDLKTIHMSAASHRRLPAHMKCLDEWSPTKMTLFEYVSHYSFVDKVTNFPSSLTDFKWASWSAMYNSMDELAQSLPKPLTRLSVSETIPSTINGTTVIEKLRRHLPHLTRLVSLGNEEVALPNGKFRNFIADIRSLDCDRSFDDRDINDYMIYDLVQRPSYNKTRGSIGNMPTILRSFPALGLHLLGGGGEGFGFYETRSLAQTLNHSDALCLWVAQLEPCMFKTEAHLIRQWLRFMPCFARKSLDTMSNVLKHMSLKLTARLFRIMLNLIWLMTFRPSVPPFITCFNPNIFSPQQAIDLLDLMRRDYQYNGFVSCHPASNFIVQSLREQLLSGYFVVDIIPMAMEIMEDGALAEAACRGLVDNDWFDRFGTWRTVCILNDLLMGDGFEIGPLKIEPGSKQVTLPATDVKRGVTIQFVANGGHCRRLDVSDDAHQNEAFHAPPSHTSNRREMAWLAVRNAIKGDNK